MDYKKELELIKKTCGQEMSFRLQGAINNLNTTNVKIVNTGMVSSGKSSLYNLLTENAKEERFPTGAARTTTIADVYNYGHIDYVDTPGIDVREADDEIAYKTVMESDIILMIHNIKTGPLIKSEWDWLHRIATEMKDPEMCKKRIIFICTWKDTREKEEGYTEILEEVKQMVFDAVGTEIPFFDVSIKKYLDGVNKDKEILCQKSGIVHLKKFIEDHARQYAGVKKEYSLEVFNQVTKEIREILECERQDKKKMIEKKKIEVRKKFLSQRNSWNGTFEYFNNQRSNLDSLKRELNNI